MLVGLIPLAYSIKARRRWAAGDNIGAVAAAERAKGWLMTFGVLFAMVLLIGSIQALIRVTH